jgi:hypothetical protein
MVSKKYGFKIRFLDCFVLPLYKSDINNHFFYFAARKYLKYKNEPTRNHFYTQCEFEINTAGMQFEH